MNSPTPRARLRAGLTSVLVLAACGSVNNGKLPDAPNVVADGPIGIDAPTVGAVTVHVLDPAGTGADAVGVSVVFIDGSDTQTVATNGSGIATAQVHDGASVTSVSATGSGFQLQTVTEIAPGDAITIGIEPVVSTPASTFTVIVPTTAGTTGVTYQAFGPCGAAPNPVALGPTAGPPPTQVPIILDVNPSCIASPATIVVHAFTTATPAAPSHSIGFIVDPGVTVNDSGSATVPTQAYGSNTALASAYTNLDAAGITAVTTGRFAPDGFGFRDTSAVATPAGGSASTSTFGPTLATTAVVQSLVANATGTQTVRELAAGSATSYTFDGPSRLLPFLGTPSLDLATGVLTVPVDATGTTGAAPDLYRVVASYSRTSGATTTTFEWFVYGPTPGNITFPTIPTSVGDVMPQATDTVGTLAAESLELDTITGYAAARLDPIGTAAQLNLAANPGATLVRFTLATTASLGTN